MLVTISGSKNDHIGPTKKMKTKMAWTYAKKRLRRTTFPNRHYSGHRKATGKEGYQGIPGKKTWRAGLSTAGGKWRRQLRQSWIETRQVCCFFHLKQQGVK